MSVQPFEAGAAFRMPERLGGIELGDFIPKGPDVRDSTMLTAEDLKRRPVGCARVGRQTLVAALDAFWLELNGIGRLA